MALIIGARRIETKCAFGFGGKVNLSTAKVKIAIAFRGVTVRGQAYEKDYRSLGGGDGVRVGSGKR